MTVAGSQSDIINLDSWGVPSHETQRPEREVPPRESWRIDSKLRQTSVRAKTSTLYTRFNQHYLLITTYRRARELPEQVIDLTFVEATPREVKDYRYKLWFAATCLLTLPAAFYSFLPVAPQWMLALVGMALVLMVLALRQRKHCYEFLALNSDVVLFQVDAMVSDETRVVAFVEGISHAVARSQARLPEGKPRIPLAVAEMRRLSEDGVISKEQYEAIKQNWFSL